MVEFVTSGDIALLALAVLTVEALVMMVMRQRLPDSLAPLDVMLMALSGGGLLLAMHSALRGGAWQTITLYLILALGAHVADVLRRLSRERAPSSMTHD